MDDLLNVVGLTMKASMSDVVALQVKCNRSTRETNYCSSSETRREVWEKENKKNLEHAQWNMLENVKLTLLLPVV